MAKPENTVILADFADTFPNIRDPFRMLLERVWFRNILYYMGEQWLDWVRSSGGFANRYRLNWGVATPVSNIIREHVRSMKALFLNKNYKPRVWPNSNEDQDKLAAELGTQILPWLDDESDGDIDEIKEMTVLWEVLCGNAFTRTYAGAEWGKVLVLDAAGNEVKKSDAVVDSHVPFNIMVPSLGVNLKRKKWIGCKTLAYREWVEDNYKINIEKSEVNTLQVDYQKQLLNLVAQASSWLGESGLTTNMANAKSNDLVVLQEKEWSPVKEYPEGRYQVVVNGQIAVNDTKLPIPVDGGKWMYTFDHFKYNLTPGGFWSTGSVDDLISPQNIINEIDAALARNRRALGRPMVITPSKLTLQRLTERGSDLLAVQYDNARAAGGKPNILSGVPYPNQILDERNNQRQVAQDAGGDPKHVLRGQSPYAGAPGIAIDILRETAEQGHGPDVTRHYKTWQRVDRKRLIIVAKTYSASRILKIAGKGSEVIVRKFKGADLHGNTDVRLELDSGLSFTRAGKTQGIMQLLQYGMWDPQKGPKPDVRRELLVRMGLAGFPEEDNIHRQRAEMENSMITQGGDLLEDIATPPMPTGKLNPQTGEPEVVGNYDPVFELDDHYTHAQVMGQLIFSREFKALSKEQKQIAILHYQYHAQKLTEQMQAEAQVQMAQAQAAQGGGQGSQPPVGA
jgi:hypothetical protein